MKNAINNGTFTCTESSCPSLRSSINNYENNINSIVSTMESMISTFSSIKSEQSNLKNRGYDIDLGWANNESEAHLESITVKCNNCGSTFLPLARQVGQSGGSYSSEPKVSEKLTLWQKLKKKIKEYEFFKELTEFAKMGKSCSEACWHPSSDVYKNFAKKYPQYATEDDPVDDYYHSLCVKEECTQPLVQKARDVIKSAFKVIY
ncbi:MAG: hypothetical protein AB1546_14815 [bacterium]